MPKLLSARYVISSIEGAYEIANSSEINDNFCRLICVTNGIAALSYSDCNLCCKEGESFLTMGDECKYALTLDGDFKAIVIKFTIEDKTGEAVCAQSFTPSKPRKWKTLLTQLVASLDTKKPGNDETAYSILYQLLAMTKASLSRSSLPSTRQCLIEKSLKHIEDNIKEAAFSVESLPPITGMCPTYYRQQFKKMYGVSPKQYLLDKRMSLAKQQLLETDKKVTDIARDSGFSSLYYFSKAFKATTGTSPRAFRLNTQGK